MGITIHYSLLAKDEDAVEAIIKKWEERYKPELDLAKIPHQYTRVDEKWCFSMKKMEMELFSFMVTSYEDLMKKVKRRELRILTEVPTLRDFLKLRGENLATIVVLPPYFGRDWKDILLDAPRIDLVRGTNVWAEIKSEPYPHERPEDYTFLPCKGFVDTPETTESFVLVFARLDGRWYAKDYIKTQAFSDEEAEPNSFIHMLICDFLKEVEKQGLAEVRVYDEGDYYETEDVRVLLRAYGATYEVIRKLVEALERMRGSSKPPAPKVETSPSPEGFKSSSSELLPAAPRPTRLEEYV